ALDDLARALKDFPGDSQARVWKGQAHLGLDQAAKALAEFDKSLALSPGLVWALIGRAMSLEKLGRLPEAHAALGEARKIQPGLFA
ncbi:MAG: tetratricopeptide repeat protein, partial [Elusimicrobiota bacterium]